MEPFAYARARDVDEALAAAGRPDTALLAGGTELLNWLRLGVAAPERVLDISRLDALAAVTALPDGGLRVGATARLADLAADPTVRRGWPVLAEAIDQAASAQLRNLATIAGNLLQKTRCPYFRSEQPVACNRRAPGTGCAALHGHHERHAIFGWSDACVATHPSDPAVALAALDAAVVARGPEGERRVAVRDLHVLPDRRVDVDTVLEPGELIVALELPAPAPRSAYVKVRERDSYEYALVAAAAAVELDGGVIRAARIALGSVALRPWRLDAAEDALVGLAPASPAAEGAIDAAMAQARPLAENGFKVRLAGAAAVRALRAAAEAAP